MSRLLLGWLRDVHELGHAVYYQRHELYDRPGGKGCRIFFHIRPQEGGVMASERENELLKTIWQVNRYRPIRSKITTNSTPHPVFPGRIYAFDFPDRYDLFLKTVQNTYW